MRVTIVGAGIIGLSGAVELALAGHDVTVVDPEPLSGATHHAGGMLAPVAEVVYQQTPLFPLMTAAAEYYPTLIGHVAAHTELPTGHDTSGTLVVAADRADAQFLTELREYQARHQLAAELTTVRQARALEPALSPRLAGAVSIPGDHQVFPRAFGAAAADAARALGVEFVTARAVSIADGDVKTASGSVIEGDHVVLAAGLGASDIDVTTNGKPLAANQAFQLRPVYGDIIRLRQPDPENPLLHRVVRGYVESRPVYLIPRTDGTLAVGATTREDDRPAPNAGGIYDLLRDAVRLVPGIEDCDFIEATAGARPGTPDDVPYLGRLSDTLTVATGFFRHGILLAGLSAHCLPALVEGAEPPVNLDACHPLRHAT